MKDKFRKRYMDFRTEMLKSRDKNTFKKKWLDNCQKEAYVYDDWLIENQVGLCKMLKKGYYDSMKELMNKGHKFNNIKVMMKEKLDIIIKEMQNILDKEGDFDYDKNLDLCLDFCMCIYYLTKMKYKPSSNTFGIIKTSKKPLEFVEIY